MFLTLIPVIQECVVGDESGHADRALDNLVRVETFPEGFVAFIFSIGLGIYADGVTIVVAVKRQEFRIGFDRFADAIENLQFVLHSHDVLLVLEASRVDDGHPVLDRVRIDSRIDKRDDPLLLHAVHQLPGVAGFLCDRILFGGEQRPSVGPQHRADGDNVFVDVPDTTPRFPKNQRKNY